MLPSVQSPKVTDFHTGFQALGKCDFELVKKKKRYLLQLEMVPLIGTAYLRGKKNTAAMFNI